jgi:sporulation protein YlmC with PRC-barrel domain
MMDKKYLSRDKIVGKEVIDSNATIIGSVKDLALDLSSKNIALTILTKTGSDIIVGGDSIIVVGDVILLNKTIELSKIENISTPDKPQAAPQPTVTPQPQPTVTPPASGLCNLCGYQNDANSKFCIKCGHKL